MPDNNHQSVEGNQVGGERPARLAIWLSAGVCPGAGQFVQGRWIRGALYAIAFLACLVLLMVEVLRPMAVNLRVALNGFAGGVSEQPFMSISWMNVLIWLVCGVGIYGAALVDTTIVYRRQWRQWHDTWAGRIAQGR